MTGARFVTCAEGVPALLGSRCAGCGAVYYPGRPVCASCGELIDDPAVPIGRHGSLERWSISHAAPTGVEAPYILGFVRLDEGPQVLAVIEAASEDWSSLAPGRRLELRAGEVGWWYATVGARDER